jgi:hypothetical protein
VPVASAAVAKPQTAAGGVLGAGGVADTSAIEAVDDSVCDLLHIWLLCRIIRDDLSQYSILMCFRCMQLDYALMNDVVV